MLGCSVYIEMFLLSPLALPKFHSHPESMAVDEGGVARFHCAVNGIPEASITWEKNRTTLNTDDDRLNIHIGIHMYAFTYPRHLLLNSYQE